MLEDNTGCYPGYDSTRYKKVCPKEEAETKTS